MTDTKATGFIEGHPRYGVRKDIETIKDAIRIERVAAEYTEVKLLGNGRLLGRCVAIDHEDRTPSMTVYTDSQRFRCYGCGASGDILDLEELAGRHLNTREAVVALSERYGVELPQRSERWHKHQNTKTEMRRKMRDGLAKVYQRRLYRMLHDVGAHAEDDAALWEEMYPAAYLAATERVFG